MNNYLAARGTIVVRLTHMEGRLRLEGATVELLNRGERYTTDKNGTVSITVPAPARALSLTPTPPARPFAVYDLRISLAGYVPISVYGVHVFEGIESVCSYDMVRSEDAEGQTSDLITVPPHGLFTEPAPEGSRASASGGAVAVVAAAPNRPVVVPETVRVHLGAPATDAVTVTVPFIDYIKSVACSEIYPTWPEESLTANIYAETTFVLNRLYTEWYPSQGYDFDVSASPAFDQYYVHRREIFANVEAIVDRIFTTYISRTGFIEPIFARFCDGVRSACAGLSQWGTVTLAGEGYDALGMVRYYYGDNTELREAAVVRTDPDSYGGTPLSVGSSGPQVLRLQNMLNRIAINYPAIPLTVPAEGDFGASTAEAVRAFQRIFALPVTGTVDEETWYRMVYVYTAVKRLAELESEGEELQGGEYPGNELIIGDRGPNVLRMEWYMNAISRSGQFPTVPYSVLNGIYEEETARAVRALQELLGLPVTGVVDKATWDGISQLYREVEETGYGGPTYGGQVSGWPRPYPGTPISRGSRGDSVYYIQELLAVISRYNSAVPSVEADGIFGVNTRDAIYAFQNAYGLTVDGVVGPLTWERLNGVYGTAEDSLPAQG